MRLFLDSSVLLAACGDPFGGSSVVIAIGIERAWPLLVSQYVRGEVEANVPRLGTSAVLRWPAVADALDEVDDVWSYDKPAVFPVRKDRPVLFTAAASADALVTLDRRDLIRRLGRAFYDLAIFEPRDVLDLVRRGLA